MDRSFNLSSLNQSSHLLNTSSSKQKYSFPKSSRFPDQKNKLNDSFYDLPSLRQKRTTSFGYGNKDIGIRYQKVSPSPERYDIPSCFKRTKNGFGFGKGREDMEVTGAFQETMQKKDVPGPGNYTRRSSMDQLGRCTIRQKIIDNSQKHLKNNPGPGAYKWQQMGQNNYYVSSRHINQINFKIPSGPRPSLISNQLKKPNVGPGKYNHNVTEINESGKYILSKNKGSMAQRFSTSPRQPPLIKHMLKTPGPTNYQKFSDFGN